MDVQALLVDVLASMTTAFIKAVVEGAGGLVGLSIAEALGRLAYLTLGLVYGEADTAFEQVIITVHGIETL